MMGCAVRPVSARSIMELGGVRRVRISTLLLVVSLCISLLGRSALAEIAANPGTTTYANHPHAAPVPYKITPIPKFEEIGVALDIHAPWSRVYPPHSNLVVRSCHLAFADSGLFPSVIRMNKRRLIPNLINKSEDSERVHTNTIVIFIHSTKNIYDSSREEGVQALIYSLLISGKFGVNDDVVLVNGPVPLQLNTWDTPRSDLLGSENELPEFGVTLRTFKAINLCYSFGKKHEHNDFIKGLFSINKQNFDVNGIFSDISFDKFLLGGLGIIYKHIISIYNNGLSDNNLVGMKSLIDRAIQSDIPIKSSLVTDANFQSIDRGSAALIASTAGKIYLYGISDSGLSSIAFKKVHNADRMAGWTHKGRVDKKSEVSYCPCIRESVIDSALNPNVDQDKFAGTVSAYFAGLCKSNTCKSASGSNRVIAKLIYTLGFDKVIFIDYMTSSMTDLVHSKGYKEVNSTRCRRSNKYDLSMLHRNNRFCNYFTDIIGCYAHTDSCSNTAIDGVRDYDCRVDVASRRGKVRTTLTYSIEKYYEQMKLNGGNLVLNLYSYGSILDVRVVPEYYHNMISDHLSNITFPLSVIQEDYIATHYLSERIDEPVVFFNDPELRVMRITKANKIYGPYMWHTWMEEMKSAEEGKWNKLISSSNTVSSNIRMVAFILTNPRITISQSHSLLKSRSD